VGCRLSHACFGPSRNSFIRIYTADGLDLIVGGADLKNALWQVLDTLDRADGESGIIQLQRPDSRQWDTEQLPSLADVPADNPLQAWQMIHRRFRVSTDESLIALAAYAAEQAAKLEKEQIKANPSEGSRSQLSQDLRAIESLNLLDDDGNLIWGGQTRIAQALGIANAGQSNRERIMAVADALQRQQRKAA
jgi:hypothetical protein